MAVCLPLQTYVMCVRIYALALEYVCGLRNYYYILNLPALSITSSFLNRFLVSRSYYLYFYFSYFTHLQKNKSDYFQIVLH